MCVTIKLPEDVKTILNLLQNNGYEAFIVGGCVRDSLLGRTPNDWDITTSATPSEVQEVFKGFKVIPTGIKYGTVTIALHDSMYEVTTFRNDGKYSDGRRPDDVMFSDNIIEDLKRRDFTINAMAYNEEDGFIDPFNGKADIRNKVIRCVGNPHKRFGEDALRILRAIRFAAQLEFYIDDTTSDAIHDLKHMLCNVSKERINNELCKVLNSNHCGVVLLAEYIDVIKTFLPVSRVHFAKRLVMNQLDSYNSDSNDDDIISRLALLLYDIDPNKVEEYLDDLKFSKLISLKTAILVDHLGDSIEDLTDKTFVWCLMTRLNEQMMRRLIFLKRCFAEVNPEQLQWVLKFEDVYNTILKNENCYDIKDLVINGWDIMSLGVEQGKEVGRILESAFEAVIEYKIKNNKDELIQYVKEELL